VSWAFRGGMDLRDEVSGTAGTVWLDHFLRTGFEMFSAVGSGGYVAEKAEGETGWVFPVGDEVHALGYRDMFADMFEAMDAGREPMETFYDGYIVNSILDACYRSARSKRWEAVDPDVWREGSQPANVKSGALPADAEFAVIKEERMPDGRTKLILKEKSSGKIVQKIKP
ncbi:MAG TPA: gfo/Idh/MocA family oxidoreductase, partial [Candidatus Aminicenantes bacterium]|nr:gfo/Idh/MocA family oxidoreductase [Candidatus Aminicenantes bacterium]